MAPTLAAAIVGRVPDSALPRRVRQREPALVAGRPADRLHLQSDRRDESVGGGCAVGRAEAGGASRAALLVAAAAPDGEGAGRGGPAPPRAPAGAGRARPLLPPGPRPEHRPPSPHPPAERAGGPALELAGAVHR